MATVAPNGFGWYAPNYYIDNCVVNTMSYGEMHVNLGSRLQVYGKDYSGQYPGGIGTGESFTIIAKITGPSGNYWIRWMIVFTGPDGYTPTYGVLEDWQVNGAATAHWGQRLHSFGALKSYNRAISFYGFSYPAGSRIWGTDFNSWTKGQNLQGFTLELNSMSRANTIAVWSVANPDGSHQIWGDEYAITHVTDRGVGCDVEGYW